MSQAESEMKRDGSSAAGGLGRYISAIVGLVSVAGFVQGWPWLDTTLKQILAISTAVLVTLAVAMVPGVRRSGGWLGLVHSGLCLLTGIAVTAVAVALQPHWLAPGTLKEPAITCDLPLTHSRLSGEYQCTRGRMLVQATPDNDISPSFWAKNVSSWEIPSNAGWQITLSFAVGQADLTISRSSGFESGQADNDAVQHIRIDADRPGTMYLRPCNPCVTELDLSSWLEITLLPTN